ncbi:MAG: ABC transporter ATP-binding protein [Chloroflexi bacterium]|nr:ABC transporter ATP-binding protein [Chloroflexota bacterium]
MEFAAELRAVCKVYDGGRQPHGAVTAVKDLDLSILQGEFFTLLGPSGCGKTTTLRMIAGFEALSSGEILIQGQLMNAVPPNKRPVNTVFQNYALFPHLTVMQNVAFGLEVARVPRAERDRRAAEALELVHLPDLGDRKPAQLSGGQQQRVALARALVNRPSLLLLDEPLGALDLKLRKEMQVELKSLQRRVGITFVYVTHDQEEALTMSDRIAVMSRGRLLQIGDPVNIYEQPATRFVADFIGETNFLRAVVLAADGMQVRLRAAGGELQVPQSGQQLSVGQAVTIAVRPEKLALHSTSAANGGGLAGILQEIVFIGTDTRYVARTETGELVTVRVQNAGQGSSNSWRIGDPVRVHWEQHSARILTA